MPQVLCFLDATEEMPQLWWWLSFSVALPALAWLIRVLCRRPWLAADLRQKRSVLDAFELPVVLHREGTMRRGVPSPDDLPRFVNLEWRDWPETAGPGESAGYIVTHPRQDQLLRTVVATGGRERGPRPTIVVGPSGCGKTVLVFSVGRMLSMRRDPWRVYAVPLRTLQSEFSSIREGLVAACELVSRRMEAGTLVIVDDLYLDWPSAHMVLRWIEDDPALGALRTLATTRELPAEYPDNAIEAWYRELVPLDVSTANDFRTLTHAVARALCDCSVQEGWTRQLRWSHIEPMVDDWAAMVKPSLFWFVQLVCSAQDSGDGYTADPRGVAEHVGRALDELVGPRHPDLKSLYGTHGVHPARAVVAVALLGASHGVAVARRFLEEALALPPAVVDGLAVLGWLRAAAGGPHRSVALAHAGLAELILAEPWVSVVADQVRGLTAQPLPRAQTELAIWRRYVGWVSAALDAGAFADLCRRVHILTFRPPVQTGLASGVHYLVSPEAMVGADPARSRGRDAPPPGSLRIPLDRVQFRVNRRFMPHVDFGSFVAMAGGRDRLLQLCGLVRDIGDGRAAVGALVIEALLAATETIAYLEQQALTGSDATMRMVAAWGLGRVKSRPAAATLQHLLLEDTSRSVRAAAARALGEIGDSPQTPHALALGLDDPDEWVREECVWSLSLICRAESMLPIIRLLVREGHETDAGNAASRVCDWLAERASCVPPWPVSGEPTDPGCFGAVACHARRGNEEANDLLRTWTQSQCVETRRAAVAAFAFTELSLDGEARKAAARDADPIVRLLAQNLR